MHSGSYDHLQCTLSPVVYEDIALSINPQYKNRMYMTHSCSIKILLNFFFRNEHVYIKEMFVCLFVCKSIVVLDGLVEFILLLHVNSCKCLQIVVSPWTHYFLLNGMLFCVQ